MASQATLPGHLIQLPGETLGRWGLWRTLAARGAGFPAADVLRLADAECAAAADRLVAVEVEEEAAREAALEVLSAERAAESGDRRRALGKIIRRVAKQGQPATAEGLAAGTVAALDRLTEARGRLEAERESYRASFAAADLRLDATLREIAGTERFHEAMVWQNRFAAETGLGAFLRRQPGEGIGTQRHRRAAQLLASYLQRYCTKNDTVGFFGPVCWARLSESEVAVTARPGKELLAARQVYFEGWAIDALAEHLAQDEAMRPWLAPRVSPFLRRDGNVYTRPSGQKFELGPLSSALLASCDGTQPARELIRRLGDIPAASEAILWKMLADFHEHGILRWGFQIPLSPTPDRTLRELLQAIGDEPLREHGLALLDELSRGRDAVTRAAGKAGELERAIGALEATFRQVTGKASTRADGQLYGGRTLVYEECRRDLDVEIGAPVLAELGPPLSLVLASARWFTHHLGEKRRGMLARIFTELSAETGGAAQLDLLTFTRAALPRMVNPQTRSELENELRTRWEKVLAIPPGARRVSCRSEDLRPLVRREFAAPGPGWQRARCHCPDLLIAASSVEAIRQGDYEIVLGEVHAAINSLDRWVFFTQHPHPEQLSAAMESDIPEPSIIPLMAKMWNMEETGAELGLPVPAVTGRTDSAARLDKDYFADFTFDPHGLPASQVLPIGDLVVERGEGGLFVTTQDRRVRFEIIDVFQFIMTVQALQTFRVLPASTYTPRVTIDRLVVARESWTLPAGTLGFAQEPTDSERFLAARRWAGRAAMPRFVYAKTALEKKPFFVDLESPVLVEILAKAIRRAAKDDPQSPVSLSEMLPGLDQVWLPDAAGNRYTCELRIVALDLGD